MSNFGKLILVPTPIGNLGDITFRAVSVLKEADIILAEDTRFSSRLIMQTLASLDRNGAKIRGRNRCAMTGRPRGYHSRFGLSRNKLRELASAGLLPGVRKGSW